MKDIKNSIDDIEVNLRDLPELTDRLADVREETLRYSQLATAQENLKHLFTVPETVVKTETQIVDGNLLDAHKALSELEQARDDLVCKNLTASQRGPENLKKVRSKKLVKSNKSILFFVKLHFCQF